MHVSFRSVISLALFGLLPLASAAHAQTPRLPVTLDTTSAINDFDASVASLGDRSAVAYLESNIDLYVSVSDGSGLGWSTPVIANAQPSGAFKDAGMQSGNETVAVHGEHVYVTWSQKPHIRFQRSVDGGQSFRPSDVLLDNLGTQVDSWSMSVSPDPGGNPALDHIHVLFTSENGSFSEGVYLVTSRNGGATFGPAVPVSTLSGTGNGVQEIALASEGQRVHATWVDQRSGKFEAWTRSSQDGGLTFGDEVTLSQVPGQGGAINLRIATAPSGIVGVCIEGNEQGTSFRAEIYAAVSLDGALSWGPTLQIGEYDDIEDDAEEPRIAVAGNNVVVLWMDDRNTTNDLFVTSSSDGGLSWLPDTRIETGRKNSHELESDGANRLAILWKEPSEDVRVAYSVDAGATFSVLEEPLDTQDELASDVGAVLNASNGNLIARWHADLRILTGGLSLCSPATVTKRSPALNADILTSSLPVLGSSWDATVDGTGLNPSVIALLGFIGSTNVTLSSGQALLVDVTDAAGNVLGLAPSMNTVASFSVTIPNDPGLCGLAVYSQAVLFTPTGIALTNSQDLVLGAY